MPVIFDGIAVSDSAAADYVSRGEGKGEQEDFLGNFKKYWKREMSQRPGNPGIVSENRATAEANDDDFPVDFKEYMKTELSRWRVDDDGRFSGWVFWSRVDDEPAPPPPNFPFHNSDFIPGTPTASWELKEKIRTVLRELLPNTQDYSLLIQFWSPVIIEGRLLLTTQNQPFALNVMNNRFDKTLCEYRIISKEYKFYVDGEGEEDLGLLGRVFRHKLPESTPNVQYYLGKEYPQLDHALRCHVRQSLALPVFESSGQSCVGVLELATTTQDAFKFFALISLKFSSPAVGLKCSDVHEHSSMQDNNKNRAIALDVFREIRRALEQVCKAQVCKANQLSLAQVWVPCSLCRDVGTSGVSCMGEFLSTIQSISHGIGLKAGFFRAICRSSHLRKGQGIVGRALLSHNMLFCTDVTQFSIAEYPLAHYARDLGLDGCFAICLQSSYIRKDIYVLEFFLPTRNKTVGNMLTMLRRILKIIKKFFSNFKLASGEDFGEELPIEVIECHNGEKNWSVQISQPTRSLSSVQQSDIADTYTQENSPGRPKRKFRLGDSEFLYPIPRWPPRERKKENPSLIVESVQGADQETIPQTSLHASNTITSSQASNTVAHTKPQDTTMQDANSVTVKARYGNVIAIKFRMSLSSGLVELQQQVGKWLDVEVGRYYIKYKDEEAELILIACDEDLQDYIVTSRWLGRNWIEILLEPK